MNKELISDSPKGLKKIFGEKLYHFFLALLVIGLPLSPFLVSVAQQLLALNWLLEGDFKNKLTRLKQRKSLWFLFLVPLVHIIWLINTHDFNYGLHDLKIKAPLLILPIIIGTSSIISAKALKRILFLFVAATAIASFVSFAVYMGIGPIEVKDIRNISIIISHIRFGLMLTFSIYILLFYFIKNHKQNAVWLNIIQIVSFCWILFFLTILQSLTSWVIIMIIVPCLFIVYHKRIGNQPIKVAVLCLILMFAGGVSALIFNVNKERNKHPKTDLASLPNFTNHGNKYINDTSNHYSENGNLIFILVSKKEMREAWAMRSELPFDGKEGKGHSIYNTALRYLTSKNSTKDMDGIMALDNEDIKLIESGATSYIYRNHAIPFIKIYELFAEIHNYSHSGNANGKTLAMRIEFAKTATHIIKKNFWFGVGTGDVKVAFDKAYIEIKSELDKAFQLRAHNQYLTFFIAFGIIGFFLCLLGLFLPAILHHQNKSFLLLVFLFIAFLSMINEDTLETQAGATFFITFYTILIFSKQEDFK